MLPDVEGALPHMVSFTPVQTALDEARIIPWVWIRQTNGEEVGYGNMHHTLNYKYKWSDISDVLDVVTQLIQYGFFGNFGS